MVDEDYVVLGYIPKQNNITNLIIGQYRANMELFYVNHVTLGVSYNKLLHYKIN